MTWIAKVRKKRAEYGRYADGVGSIPNRIKALGFKSYAVYLQSNHWLALRASVLKERGCFCEACGSGGIVHVHHKTYANLGNEVHADLVVLCARCHDRVHQSEKMGGHRGLEGALKRLVKRVGKKTGFVSKIPCRSPKQARRPKRRIG